MISVLPAKKKSKEITCIFAFATLQVRAAPLIGPACQQQRCAKVQAGGGGMYPKVYEGGAVPPNDQELTTAQKEMLQLGTALRNIGWLSFWSQLILTSVSAVILLFSVGVTSQGSLSINAIDIFTFVGVAAGLMTTGLSWTWIRAGRRLAFLQEIKLQQCMATVLACTNLNLIGMGAAILGLQATVGALVAKTLSASASYYGPKAAPPPVAFDVFSVQVRTSSSNLRSCIFEGLVLIFLPSFLTVFHSLFFFTLKVNM